MTQKYNVSLKILLGSIFLWGSTDLQANAVWIGNTDDILENPLNWAGNILPTSSTIAEFGAAGTSGTTVETTTGISVLGILFDSNAPNAYYIYNDTTDTISIGLSGVVNNSPYTQQLANDSSGAGLFVFAGGTAGNNMNYSSYNTTPGGGITFLSATNGSESSFILGNHSTFTTNGDSSVGSLNCSATDNVVIASGSLTTGSLNADDYVYGVISGPGALILSTTNVTGYLSLNNANTFTGGTVVNAVADAGLYTFGGGTLPPTGTIAVNSGTLAFTGSDQTTGSLSGSGGRVSLNSPYGLTVNQTTNQAYDGTFTGASGSTFILGTLESTTAVGTLQLTGDSSAFAGSVVVNSGNLQVNNNLGAGSITVNSGATLSGNGTFGTTGNTTTIALGGILSPGNSVGVITNAGNQVFSAGSIYRLEENGYTTGPITPSIDLLIVNGTATVNAASVNLVTTDGYINLNTKQIFLTAEGGLTVNNGGFTVNTAILTSFNPAAYVLTTSYDANNYYILMQTQFRSEVADNGGDKNALSVATQLDSLVDPNTSENLFLSELVQLSTPELIDVLDDLSGAQYATEVFAAEVSNRQFIRRLYDPIREIVTAEPCDACGSPVDLCCQFLGFDVWAEAGGGQRQFNGNLGLKVYEWNVTLGLQQTFYENWTVGVASSYEHDARKYHSSNGSGRGYTWFGGLYGLYRPSCYYVLADIAYGYTQNKVHRQVEIGDVTDKFTGTPKVSQVTFYAEAGIDYSLRSFLIQPFIGIEVAGFHRNSFSESDISGSDLALNIHKKNRTAFTSSLGIHLTDQFCSGFAVSVDLAWLYRFTDNNNFRANFESFGTDFTDYGKKVGRSSGEGTITFSKGFSDNARVFIESSGEIWSNAYAYNILSGFQYTW